MDRHERDGGESEELLRRALLDESDSAAVALRVVGLALSDALTVVFHGRRDLGAIQTYVAPGGHGAGAALSAAEMLRVPCDLDLSPAEDRDEAAALYVEQARALRDALVAADTVLAIWREPLRELAGDVVEVDHSVALGLDLPAHRLMPVALTAPERGMAVVAVCAARPLAEGRPPMGIACTQQDVAHVYALPDDPARCLADFAERSAEHARSLSARLAEQEASVARFLELSDGFSETG